MQLLNAEISCAAPTIPTAEPQVEVMNLHGRHVLFDANSLVAVSVPSAVADAARRGEVAASDLGQCGGALWSRAQPQWPLRPGRPQKITLSVTNRCNLACGYCFVQDAIRRGEVRAQSMTLEIATAALDLLKGEVNVSFFGGEPLMEIELMRQVVAEGRRRSAARISPPELPVTLRPSGGTLPRARESA